MTTWQDGRKEYGPHCTGSTLQWAGELTVHWKVTFEQRDAGETIILHARETVRHRSERTAQAACDAQVEKWRREFPGLLIVDEETPAPPGTQKESE